MTAPPDGSTDPNDLVDWFTPYGGYQGDPNGGPCILSIWSYMESNDIPGLQRGDIAHDDTCGGMIQSDSHNPPIEATLHRGGHVASGDRGAATL